MTDKQLLEKLVKGQEEIKTELQEQAGILGQHGKALKKLTTLANKNYKAVEYMSGDFDERIVENSRRTDRIEDNLNLPPYKTKQ
ncbi:MAG TPA: hypothetical protein VLG67_01865 [Candidatus Saccharimonadales bacterium]|nr:hypothetical protein [Candidatus Saccharimonadales bacterium]